MIRNMPKYLNIFRESGLQLVFTFLLFCSYETAEKISDKDRQYGANCIIFGIDLDFITDMLRAVAFGFILTHYSQQHSFHKNPFLNDIDVLEEFCLLSECRRYFALYLGSKHPPLKKSFEVQMLAYRDDSVTKQSCYGDHFSREIVEAFDQYKRTASFRSLDRQIRENAHVMARGFAFDS